MNEPHAHGARTAWFVLAALLAVAVYFLNIDLVQWHQDTVGETLSATCIARFGTDEHGARIPKLALEGFGDFKEPVFSHLVSLAFLAAKPSALGTRAVSLVLGLVGVALCVLFAKRVVSPRCWDWAAIPFFCLGLLSLWIMGPYYFGCGPALSVPIAALILWTSVKLAQSPASAVAGAAFGLAAAIAPYSYPALRFLSGVNCLVLVIVVLVRDGRAGLAPGRAKGLYLGYALFACALLPFLIDALTSMQGLYRPAQVIEADPLVVLANMARMFDPYPLFIQLSGESFYATGYGGQLNLVFLPFAALGAAVSLGKACRGSWLHAYLLVFTVLAMVPASLVRPEFTVNTVHRNLVAFPGLVALAFCGAEAATGYLEGRPVAVASALLACLWLVGGYEAFKTVRQFGRAATVCADFDRPTWLRQFPASWDGPERLAHCDDFTPETVDYRYYRLVVRGDLCYCNAPAKGSAQP